MSGTSTGNPRRSSPRTSLGTTRDDRILKWLPLVRLIAAKEFRRLGGLTRLLVIDLDDLVQSGVLGLMAAIDQFDPELSASSTYFSRRIRWAILDFLRSFPYFKHGEPLQSERAAETELDLRMSNCDELRRLENRLDVEKLTGSLSERQQEVISALMADSAQHSIASRLDITNGRVSQIKNESLAAMRSRVASTQAFLCAPPEATAAVRTPTRDRTFAESATRVLRNTPLSLETVPPMVDNDGHRSRSRKEACGCRCGSRSVS